MRTRLACAVLVGWVAIAPAAHTENVDPGIDGSRFAWSENLGWVNAEPGGNGGPGVQMGDAELSGWMYGENAGWISLSCQNSGSCGTQAYGVTNDGAGNLGGFAWSENLGWVSFSCANTSSCGTASYGVVVDPSTGIWSGFAWSENAGWISFNCTNTASCGTADYRVRTDWVCNPLPAAPAAGPLLELAKAPGGAVLSWDLVAGATGSDIVRGDLGTLRATAGNFGVATSACLGNDRTTTSLSEGVALAPGQGAWYLVRAQNCGGNGTWNTSAGQIGSRDPEIAACP